VLGGLLTDRINESIEKGVIPIQKISKTIKCSEFRPVPEKLWEIFVKNQFDTLKIKTFI
jgi:hypothetical protein